MDNFILEYFLNKGINFINPDLYYSWETYVKRTLSFPGGIKKLNDIIDLLAILEDEVSNEEFESYSNMYSKSEMIMAKKFSDKYMGIKR